MFELAVVEGEPASPLKTWLLLVAVAVADIVELVDVLTR